MENNDLYLVTERNETSASEVNYLYTGQELFGPHRPFPECSTMETGVDGDWRYLSYRETKGTPTEWRFHVVDMTHGEEHAAHDIAQFLSGAHNREGSTWENDPMRTSPSARKMLAELMRPVLAADFGSNKWMYQMGAIEWSKEHQPFVDDLDHIYTSLDLVRVERSRSSVTQGEVPVSCNGRPIVRYGDEICLQKKDGTLLHSMSGRIYPGPMYGPVIGGWGSSKPDSNFSKAAIVQYDNLVYDALQSEPLREVEVWQLGRSEDALRARFLSYDLILKYNGSFRPELYECVWKGSVTANDLEDIYRIFNVAHPQDYKAPSLSVSDVVKVDGKFYFCDSIGFRKIDFDRNVQRLDDKVKNAQEVSSSKAQTQPEEKSPSHRGR